MTESTENTGNDQNDPSITEVPNPKSEHDVDKNALPAKSKKLDAEEKREFKSILRECKSSKTIDEYSINVVRTILSAYLEDITYEDKTNFIRKNFNLAMEVAVALYDVKSNKLYKLKYKTFEEYVEEEFNFTKTRAYQLLNAHLIAKDINTELNGNVIENESQARELLRLKYLKAGEADEATTRQERVKLIAELRGQYADKPIPATKIAEKVKSMMPVYRNAHLGKMKVEQHQSSLDKIRKTYVEKFKKIYSYESLTDDEKAKLKQDAITALRAIANELEHSDAASANGNQK